MADWLNNDLSDYIGKKEKVIIDTRKNDKMCCLSGLFGALFATIFTTGFSTVFSGIISDSGKTDFAVVFVSFLVSFPLFVWLIYNSQRSTRYVLTNCGIYKITGLVFKKTKFVAYNQITDVSINKGPVQSMFGVGSVGVGTASGNVVGSVSDGNGSIYSINELDITSVDNYKKIREIIIKNRKK